jgi:hypothetical protein
MSASFTKASKEVKKPKSVPVIVIVESSDVVADVTAGNPVDETYE